jgi:DNA-binding MarR family transcriptional regulator
LVDVLHNIAVAANNLAAANVLRAYLDAVALSEPMLSRIWEEAAITLVQLRALRKLAHEEKALGQLGGELALSPTSVTRLVDRLEERGLVERRRPSGDRRRVVAVLTAAGRSLVNALPFLEGSDLQAAVERMPAADRERIATAFRDFVAAVRSLEEAPVGTGSRPGR